VGTPPPPAPTEKARLQLPKRQACAGQDVIDPKGNGKWNGKAPACLPACWLALEQPRGTATARW